MKVLFMGTPEFAVPSLRALIESSHEVVGVVTQPDRAVKHGKTESGAVKLAAADLGLKIIQPEKIRDCVGELKAFGADIAVTAAYGQLLTQTVLDAFPRGVINVHASLLPKYRGASPIAAAIENGEAVTGVTIMQTALGLDSGDILSVARTEIGKTETAGELTGRLAEMGAKLLISTLDGFDKIVPIKQDDTLATHCRTIKKHEQIIDFSRSAQQVVDKIRALSPLPSAKTSINGEVYKLYAAAVAEDSYSGSAGEIVRCDSKLVIACRDGCVEILKIQAPSKRVLDIAEFLRGKKFAVGTVCGK
ncbi:MAG: methionyl-tRNA formyltransferase [Clostridiales bacterium]|nr:methionyl-tRNA formyltransferase [Clostridiales bacterium]